MGKTLIGAHVYHADNVSIDYRYGGPQDEGAYDLTLTHGLFIVRQIVNLSERPCGLQLRSNLRKLTAGKPTGIRTPRFKEFLPAKRGFTCFFSRDDTGVDFALDAFGFGRFASGKLDQFAAASAVGVAINALQMSEGTDSYSQVTDFVHEITADAASFTIKDQFPQTAEILSGVLSDSD